ncbi:MAG TPA: hypothetical protein VE981_05790 [Planctomycetota bacterium]|nr:hypothetical protein [Planctomycetota bacterium]
MNLKLGRRSELGMSLISMLVVVILVGGIASAFFLLSVTERQSSDVVRFRTKSYYLGEAAIEQVAAMLKNATTGYIMPSNPVTVAGAPRSSTTGGTPVTMGGLVSDWEWYYLNGSTWQQASAANVTSAVAANQPESLQLHLHGTITINDGYNAIPFTYTVVNFRNLAGVGVGNTQDKNFYSIVIDGRVRTLDTPGNKSLLAKGTQVKITREIELLNQSLLPFFAFYNGDLEFLPGPAFVGNGKVHTNTDLYLGGGTSIDLNTDYVGAVGQIYRHRKNNGSYTDNAGPVTLHPPIPGTPAPGAIGVGSTPWSNTLESASTSGGTTVADPNWAANSQTAGIYPTVKNGATGAQQMATPPIGSIQPPATAGGTGGNYYEWAKNPSSSGGSVSSGLVISVSTTGTVSAMYNNGTGQVDVTNALTSAGAITQSTIADNRQSQSVASNTTVVDMKKLKTSGYLPSGGILYTTDARNGTPSMVNGQLVPPAAPAQSSGFVFQNGQNLSTNTNPNIDALNIVSNGPVYVQGDFNAPNGTTTDPVSGQLYQKVNAAVIADAVNLLSNSWNGSKTAGGAPPTASDTNYNFAMITGNVPTINSTGQYSGGLENLPRFHENWGGIKCNYRGSLINLWTSAIATGAWGQGNVYSPPNRNWDWDSSFGASSVKIPGFPKAVSISRTIFMMDYWGAGGSGSYRSAQ